MYLEYRALRRKLTCPAMAAYLPGQRSASSPMTAGCQPETENTGTLTRKKNQPVEETMITTRQSSPMSIWHTDFGVITAETIVLAGIARPVSLGVLTVESCQVRGLMHTPID
jgi:hypothetical protein